MANVAFSPTPNVSTPAGIQPAPANTAAQPDLLSALPSAIADSPAETLNVLRQRHPLLSDAQLSFRTPITNLNDKGPTGTVGHENMTPIVLGGWDGVNTKVALMPIAGVPGQNAGEVSANMQQYVRNGEALYQDIIGGRGPTQPSKDDIKNVMWYLQALASNKALESSGGKSGPALFANGAMTIEDRGGHLANFFESANSYPRGSVHLTELQNAPGGQPFGVDVRGVSTPNEKRAVLLQRLPEGAMGGKQMLFIKMEEHGCRGLSFKGTGEGPQAESELSGWDKFKRGVQRFFSNLGDFIMFKATAQQAGGLVTGGAQDNRERVDAGTTQLFAALSESLQNGLSAFHSLSRGDDSSHSFADDMEKDRADALSRGINEEISKIKDSGSAGGVHRMLDGISTISTFAESLKKSVLESLWGQQADHSQLLELLKPVDEMLTKLNDARREILKSSGDHPELRFGREVILTADEMQTGGVSSIPNIDDTFEGGRVNRTLTLSPEDTAAWKDSLEFVANFSEAYTADPNDQFGKDLLRSDDFSIFIQNPGAGEADPEPYYRSGDYNQLEGNAGDRVDAGLNALEWVFDEEGGIINAVKNLTHQGALAEMSTMLFRDMFTRYGETLTLNNGPQITEITKRAPHPDNPNLLVCDINLSTQPYTFVEKGLNGGLRGKINIQESSMIFKAGFRLVCDTQTKRISAEVITPPTVDVTLIGQDAAPPAASPENPRGPARVISRPNR